MIGLYVDNFLDYTDYDTLYSTCMGHNNGPRIQWTWCPHTASVDDGVYQFTHSLITNRKISSTFYLAVVPLIDRIKTLYGDNITIYKMKVNLLPKREVTDIQLDKAIHVDLPTEWLTSARKFISFVYYVNDSEGDTVIVDDQHRIVETHSPKKNCCLFFPSEHSHRATPPTTTDRRVIVSGVFEL